MGKTSQNQLKAVRENYEYPPFFYKEDFQEGSRIIAWSPQLIKLKKLVYAVLDTFPKYLEVLFKIRPESYEQNDEWIRYCGEVTKQTLLNCFRENEKCLFEDGENELCVRRLDNEEYFALDDHDILFIYSEAVEYMELCRKLGFEEKENPLIYDAGHWHVSPNEAEETRKVVVEYLRIEKIDE